MKKGSKALLLAAFFTLALLSGMIFTGKVCASTAQGGWHLVESKYYPSALDITILGGAYEQGRGLYDTFAGEGSEGEMRFSHTRKDANGKTLAYVNYQVNWEKPPAYLAPEKKTGFNIEMKVLSFSSGWDSSVWASAHFDSADLPGASYATAGKIPFRAAGGGEILRNMKTYFESSKVIPAGKKGDKKAIWLNLGNGYGYAYIYEWRETAAPGTPPATPPADGNYILLQLDNPRMSVNGVSQEIDPGRGTTPIVISGRTMIPIRAVVEAMGGTLKWEEKTRKITLTAKGNTVEMWLDKKEIRVNGATKMMDVAPVSQNGRTYVPLRFAAENLQAKVDWNSSRREALLTF